MIDSQALKVTTRLTDILDEMGIAYVIGGSMASIIHGILRTTHDVDIVAAIGLNQVSELVERLEGAFYLDEPTIRQAIERHSSFNLIHLDSMFKVDIFIPRNHPFDRQQLERRQERQLGGDSGQGIWVSTAEDIVLAKLEWFRSGGEISERQWRDILGVLKTQGGSLDVGYLQYWAATLEVSDLLERALEASELG